MSGAQGNGSVAAEQAVQAVAAGRVQGASSYREVAPCTLEVRAASLDRMRPTEFLWEGWLVRGVLNLLVGEEGVGKGVMLAWLIAQITRGRLPGVYKDRPADVLWIGDEDSFAHIVMPRLFAAGADLDRVHELVDGDGEPALLDVKEQAELLDPILQRGDYALVVSKPCSTTFRRRVAATRRARCATRCGPSGACWPVATSRA